jgi:CPA1 family monovalent cation:H+ antiporter
MGLFELVIALLFAGALFALWSDRLGVPYPALLALVGALIALVPGAPTVTLDPELALVLFVAPTLLDAAYDASPRDLKRNLWSLVGLAVVLVLLTVVTVGWVARLVMPDLGWAAAFALGAIVAPPDASAATAVLRKLRPPHRLLVILQGESLFNDATALLIYRVAVGAAMTGALSGWKLVPLLLVTCGGGVVLGWVLARLAVVALTRVKNIPVSVLLQFVSTFAVWIIADRLKLSAIITMVVYAMTIAQRVGGRMNARHRIASYAVWDVAVLVLNVLAFVLIGLQLRGILSRVQGPAWRTYALCAVAVCLTVIVVRIAWVMTYGALLAWRRRRRPPMPGKPPPTVGSGILASWCGMRGIVTLADALALPQGSPGFPHRDLIVFSAFCVVLTTLVLQGLTLRPLLHWLCLGEVRTVEREVGIARAETSRAALRALELLGGPSSGVDVLRAEYRARLHAPESPAGEPRSDGSMAALQRKAVEAQRDALTELRARQVIGDDAFHVVEEEIDLMELTADARVRPAPDGAGG